MNRHYLKDTEVLERFKSGMIGALSIKSQCFIIFSDGRRAPEKVLNNLLSRKLIRIESTSMRTLVLPALCADCDKPKILHQANDGCPRMAGK